MNGLFRKLIVAASLMLASVPALAYIGPGSGISLLGGLWGVLVAIVLAIGAVLVWPIRYMFRRLRRKRRDAAVSGSSETAHVSPAVEPEHSTHRPD